MNNRLSKTSDSTASYRNTEGQDIPSVLLMVYDPLKLKKISVLAKIDTSFTGGLIIPSDVYIRLGLQMFEEPKNEVMGQIVTGDMMGLRCSKGIVETENTSISCEIYTTFLPIQPAVGLEILNSWKVTLDGVKRRVKITVEKET